MLRSPHWLNALLAAILLLAGLTASAHELTHDLGQHAEPCALHGFSKSHQSGAPAIAPVLSAPTPEVHALTVREPLPAHVFQVSPYAVRAPPLA